MFNILSNTLTVNYLFLKSTFEKFSYYIKDLLRIRKLGAENNLKLCRFQPGERITCKVERLGDEGGCLVILPNGVQGLVPPRLCPGWYI